MGEGFPYRMAIETGSSISFFKAPCCCLLITMSGEPFSVQIDLYASADLGARKGTMIAFTSKARNNQGLSITLSSIKNSSRYRLTSFTDVESGEPRFMRTIALFITRLAKLRLEFRP